MKVYIATTGQYSDYAIRGVFSSEQAANNFLHLHYGSHHASDVEEWDVDGRAHELPTWWVRTDHTGAIFTDRITEDVWSQPLSSITRSEVRQPSPSQPLLFEVFVWAKDRQHAQRIGADLIAPFRARQLGAS